MVLIGGTYFESCIDPNYYQLYGSGLRAACSLSNIRQEIQFVSCIGKSDVDHAKYICSSFNVDHNFSLIDQTIRFNYYHPLSRPSFSPFNAESIAIKLPDIKTENILFYGMLEASCKVDCSYAVYDPQNHLSFKNTGSNTEHLALILNRQEAIILSETKRGKMNLEKIGKSLLKKENAEVVVIKNGCQGALVVEKSKITFIPVFQTSTVWPIGSGDIFSAAFAWQWMIEHKSASKAAILSSQYTANFCQDQILPLSKKPEKLKALPRLKKVKTIYLAGPFFNTAQRWLIHELQRILINLGNKVFSPYHDVGVTDSIETIAKKDIQGIKKSDAVLAIIDCLDAGTLFEIGYAKALNKRVVVLAETVSENDLTMLQGSGCEVVKDFATAVYKVSW